MKNTSTTSSLSQTIGIILLLIILCIAGITLFESQARSSYEPADEQLYEEHIAPKTAEELRAELLEKEQSNPAKYLVASGKHWRNLVDQLVVEGDVMNNASVAAFKDPVITVEWYSKTKTIIGTEHYRLYEFVKPGREVHYKLKMDVPLTVKDIAIGVTDATPVQ